MVAILPPGMSRQLVAAIQAAAAKAGNVQNGTKAPGLG
jgi:hypothetical protein